MLGLLENSRPRGQRTGGNPSRGLHCKAKGVPHGPGSPLRAPQGVNDGSLPHSQAAIALTIRTLLSAVIIVLSTALLVGATNNAFIYTRF